MLRRHDSGKRRGDLGVAAHDLGTGDLGPGGLDSGEDLRALRLDRLAFGGGAVHDRGGRLLLRGHLIVLLRGHGLAIHQPLISDQSGGRQVSLGLGRSLGRRRCGSPPIHLFHSCFRLTEASLSAPGLGGDVLVVQLDQELAGLHHAPLANVKGEDSPDDLAGEGRRGAGPHGAGHLGHLFQLAGGYGRDGRVTDNRRLRSLGRLRSFLPAGEERQSDEDQQDGVSQDGHGSEPRAVEATQAEV